MLVENTLKEYAVNDKGQFSCQYYITFCTRFNRRIFTEQYSDILKEILEKINDDNEFGLLDMIISPDTIQCIVSCPPDISIQKCVNTIKAMAAKELYQECPELKSRMPQMWTKKNFISSMGNVAYNSVCSYIESQRKE